MRKPSIIVSQLSLLDLALYVVAIVFTLSFIAYHEKTRRDYKPCQQFTDKVEHARCQEQAAFAMSGGW